MKVLAFRLFARLAGALHLLLRMPRGAFPYRLFGMLSTHDTDRFAEELLKVPSCRLDPFSQKFLEQHSTVEALCAAVSKLEALGLMCETDVVCIESRHAAARRLLVSRQQTWSYSFTDIAAEHLCRQFHKSQDDMLGAKKNRGNHRKKRQPRKQKRRAKPPTGKKKGGKPNRTQQTGNTELVAPNVRFFIKDCSQLLLRNGVIGQHCSKERMRSTVGFLCQRSLVTKN